MRINEIAISMVENTGEKISRKTIIAILVVLLLCIADSITTLLVLNSGKGYEANAAIAMFASIPAFHVVKFALTALVLYGIHRICKNDEITEISSYLTLVLFYSLIVINNISVYLSGMGFSFNLPKMAAILFGIFLSLYVYLTYHPTNTE